MADELVEGFKRQRRNLMVMSVVVFFTQYVGLQIDTLSVFGNTAVINDPDKLHIFLWVLLCYWLIRYTQYLHEIGFPNGWSDFYIKRNRLVESEELELRESESDKTRAVIAYLEREQGARAELPVNPYSDESTPLPTMNEIKDVTVRLNAYSGSRLMRYSLQCGYEFNTGREVYYFTEKRVLKLRELLVPNMKALAYVIIRKRFFTEYLLPFVLFLIPVGYAAAT